MLGGNWLTIFSHFLNNLKPAQKSQLQLQDSIFLEGPSTSNFFPTSDSYASLLYFLSQLQPNS